MPVAATSALGHSRSKITKACEMCRKRKARCSGTLPCDFCQKHSFTCEFVLNRQRRGPRPKSRELDNDDADMTIDQPGPIVDNTTSEKAIPPSQDVSTAGGNPHFDISRETKGRIEGWQDALKKVMDREESFATGNAASSLSLWSHLIDIFFAHVNNQQAWLLDPQMFSQQLLDAKCSSTLINAICAVSIKYSRNRLLQGQNGKRLRQNFYGRARSQSGKIPNSRLYLDRINTVCILIVYNFSTGNGRQAWLDISTANSLIQLVKAGELISLKEQKALALSQKFLYITERAHCVGHTTLCPLIEIPQCNHSSEFEPTSCISSLFDLLLQIQKFSSKSATACEPPPWDPCSDFMNLVEKLDRYMLWQSEDLRFSMEKFLDMISNNQQAAEYILSSLTWHCCVILLNRVFLPIPQRKVVDNANAGQVAMKEINLVHFPSAPKPFLQERISACEGSAAIICNLCKDLIASNYFILPSFMGYCCFQSSIVIINQLRRSMIIDNRVVESLKVNFTILGAMQTLFKPARKWGEALFELLPEKAHLTEHISSTSELFSNYFARYKDIKEPPYISLLEDLRDETIEEICHAPPKNSITSSSGNGFQVSLTNDSTDWRQHYLDCLEGQIGDINSTTIPEPDREQRQIEEPLIVLIRESTACPQNTIPPPCNGNNSIPNIKVTPATHESHQNEAQPHLQNSTASIPQVLQHKAIENGSPSAFFPQTQPTPHVSHSIYQLLENQNQNLSGGTAEAAIFNNMQNFNHPSISSSIDDFDFGSCLENGQRLMVDLYANGGMENAEGNFRAEGQALTELEMEQYWRAVDLGDWGDNWMVDGL